MKSYFKFLSHNKLYTFIEVVGMAVALAFVLFIGTFVISGITADSQVKKQGNIYVGHFERLFITSGTDKEVLEGKFPEVEDICCVLGTSYYAGTKFEMTCGDHTEKQDALIVDPNFFEFFPFPLAEGSPATALQEKNALLLSQGTALRLFGDRNPIGEMIKLTVKDSEYLMTVTGVFQDFTNTALHAPNLIYRTDLAKESGLMNNGNGTTTYFFRIADGTDVEALSGQILPVLQENDFLYKHKLFNNFDLVPFKDINKAACDAVIPFEGLAEPDFIRLFLTAGLLLLLFAIVNYIALTVAQTGFRAKEMASRRLLGEQRGAIMGRYVLESFILTAVAFLLALLLAWACAPYFSELVGRQVNPFRNFNWLVGLFMAVVVVLLSVLSGIIPAIVVSKFKPMDVVRGNFAKTSKMTLSKILITCQNVIALVTLSVAIVMLLQLKHMISKPMGYERDGRISIGNGQKAADYCVDELRQFAFVEKTGWLMFSPMTFNTAAMTMPKDGTDYNISCFYGDQDAFDILGFEVLQQNSEPNKWSVWLTESLMRTLGLDYDCTVLEFDNGHFQVNGIVRDFSRGDANGSGVRAGFYSMPWVLEMESEDDFQALRELVVQVSGDENEALRQIQDFYRSKGFAEDEIQVHTYNQLNKELYNLEDQNLQLISLFTLLTLLLSAMAMLAMSAYYARQHAKTAALRKVLGCSRGRLYASTAAGFLKSVGIAVIIALPVAYLIAGRWLQGFNYRIDNYVWVYLLAALIMAAVAVMAVSWQTVRLMNTQPAKALKAE